MGRDNQAKDRQLRRKSAKEGRRARYDRILVVTEGSKTEPLYLGEICAAFQLQSARVAVQPSRLGTEPEQVVAYAQQLFEKGDLHRGIRPHSFDQVFAVFDRDEHRTYFDALAQAKALSGKLRNDEREPVPFVAIASIPNFELWLLLHYESIQAPIHRAEALNRVKQHLPNYEKGAGGVFSATRPRLETATQRAQTLAEKFSAYTDPEPYTALHELVTRLTTLRA